MWIETCPHFVNHLLRGEDAANGNAGDCSLGTQDFADILLILGPSICFCFLVSFFLFFFLFGKWKVE